MLPRQQPQQQEEECLCWEMARQQHVHSRVAQS